MADIFNRKKRSQIMSRVKCVNTAIERDLLQLLLRLGMKPRQHIKHMPGSPDFVLQKNRVVIFANGCFWHGHDCKRAGLPATNRKFWIRKVSANVRRDRRQRRLLRKMGWRVITFWSCKKVGIKGLVTRLRRVGVQPKYRLLPAGEGLA